MTHHWLLDKEEAELPATGPVHVTYDYLTEVILEADDTVEIDVEKVRWGTRHTIVFSHGGRHYQMSYRVHHEEGIDDGHGPWVGTEVVPRSVTKTVWVPKR